MGWYRAAADLVLIVHAAFIAFVLFGLVAIVIGYFRGWEWTRRWGFRGAHLAAIGYVVFEAYMELVCPLTTLENHLRVQGGQAPYGDAGFIASWLHRLIFFRASPWVFTLCYTAFALLVVATFIFAPPRRKPRRQPVATDGASLNTEVTEVEPQMGHR